MEGGKSGSDVLNELLKHLDWCLSNYTDNDSCDFDCSDDHQHKVSRPDWTHIRSFQNNLYGFLDRQGDSQATAIASLLIYIIDNTFSDLCAATPWDNEGVIDAAREKAHRALINLLMVFRDAIQNQDQIDTKLWGGFRSFEEAYNNILNEVNDKDQAIIEKQNHLR